MGHTRAMIGNCSVFVVEAFLELLFFIMVRDAVDLVTKLSGRSAFVGRDVCFFVSWEKDEQRDSFVVSIRFYDILR